MSITATQRQQVVFKAQRWAFDHLPYRFGALPSSGATDCSGLTLESWQGIFTLPHNAQLQAEALNMVDPTNANASKLLPGDLVFYKGSIPGEYPGHVGVFIYKIGDLSIVAQATDTEDGTEVIKKRKYEKEVGYGFVGHS